jgi:tetratricopeptide (TPR) repeat protein
MPQASRPQTVAEILSAANELMKSGDCAGAVDMLSPYAAPQSASVLVLLKLSEALMRAGRSSDAIQFLNRAYHQEPANPECAFLLGRVLIDSNLFDRALPLLRQALEADRNSYKVNWALANYHAKCERNDLAIPYYEAALLSVADPVQRSALMLELGSAHKNFNQPDKAAKVFRQVSEPETMRLAALIQLFSLEKNGPDSPAAAQLEAIARTTHNPFHRAEALLQLAKANNAIGKFDVAFSQCKEARAGQRIVNHHAEILEQDIAFKKKIFTRQLFEQTAPQTSDDGHIVLIGGMPRSGTTLLEQVLGAHTSIEGFGETGRFIKLSVAFQRQVESLQEPIHAILTSAARGELALRSNDNIKFLRSISDKEWSRAVEKTPMNYEAMGYVHLVHPKARFLLCRRHPADSFISSYENPLSAYHDYAYDQVTYAEKFLAKEELVKHWKQVFPEQIIEVDYETLVRSPEPEVRRILDFLGLKWEDGTMKFFERATTVRTFSTQQVRSSFYSTSVGRWKNYERHLKPLFDKLQSASFVYETAG